MRYLNSAIAAAGLDVRKNSLVVSLDGRGAVVLPQW
jgi:hypothetical protein